MVIESANPIGGCTVNDNGSAFGYDISLKYLKKGEWENLHYFGSKNMKKIGSLIEIIQKNGPKSSSISNRATLVAKSLRHDSRFYKAIKDDINSILKHHYEFKYKRQNSNMRVIMSFEAKAKAKGYLVCFDHNHTSLNTN